MRQSGLTLLVIALLLCFSSTNANDKSPRDRLAKPNKQAMKETTDKKIKKKRTEDIRNLQIQEPYTANSTGGCPSKVSTRASTSPAC